jgi:hypothetical protein
MYCNIDEAFENNINNNFDPDKAARMVNSLKKKNQNDVYRKYRKNGERGIDNRGSFYSAQGKYFCNGSPDDNFYDQIEPNYFPEHCNDSNFSLTDDISSNNVSIDTPSEEIELPQYKKKNQKNHSTLSTPSFNGLSHSSFGDSADDVSSVDYSIDTSSDMESFSSCNDSTDSMNSDNIFRHIKKCDECKHKTMDFIKKHKNNYYPVPKKREGKRYKHIEFFDERNGYIGDIREILTICMLGFIIILILDILLKGGR